MRTRGQFASLPRSSGGVSQPAEIIVDVSESAYSIADASQLGAVPTVRLRIGTFNCGIQQEMLSVQKHIRNLRRVITKLVGEQWLHMVNLCEVGSHKQGLSRSMMCAQELISSACLSSHYMAMSCLSYMAVWQATTEESDDDGVTITQVGEAAVVDLTSPSIEPQLIVSVFDIACARHPDKRGLLISGILHIRTPAGRKSPSNAIKKRITQNALLALDRKASREINGASQPIAPVLVLTGDANLAKNHCDSLVQEEYGQPSLERQWQVLTSISAKSGDVLFMKGTVGEAFDCMVGASYPGDRGISNDQHDLSV